jgi:hypothetical protein
VTWSNDDATRLTQSGTDYIKQPNKRDAHHKSKNQYQSDIIARIVYYREQPVNSLAYL